MPPTVMSNGNWDAGRKQKASLQPTTTDRLPPHSEEAEQGVLGCIILSPQDCIGHCIEQLKAGPEMFYEARHQAIYGCMLEMYSKSQPIDTITLQQLLRNKKQLDGVGGIAYLASLPDCVPSAANLDYYVEIVREKYSLRRLVAFCTDVVSRCYDHQGEVPQLLDEIAHDVETICKSDHTPHRNSATQCVSKFIDDTERRWLKDGPSGLLTGYHDFDTRNDGLQLGEQFIIGARPGVGKTAIGLNLIHKICITDNIPAVFISLEMSTEALMRRLASKHCRIPLWKLVQGDLDQGDFEKLAAFNAMIAHKPLTIHDFVRTGATAPMAAAIVKRAAADGVKLFVLDYLQKFTPHKKNEKKTYEIAEISTMLRGVAVDCKIAMVTLAQLNREPDKEKKKPRTPRVSDLADCGQIEKDADVIGLLDRNRAEPEGAASLDIAKNRDGESGFHVNLHWRGVFCEFSNGTTPAGHEI